MFWNETDMQFTGGFDRYRVRKRSWKGSLESNLQWNLSISIVWKCRNVLDWRSPYKILYYKSPCRPFERPVPIQYRFRSDHASHRVLDHSPFENSSLTSFSKRWSLTCGRYSVWMVSIRRYNSHSCITWTTRQPKNASQFWYIKHCLPNLLFSNRKSDVDQSILNSNDFLLY